MWWWHCYYGNGAHFAYDWERSQPRRTNYIGNVFSYCVRHWSMGRKRNQIYVGQYPLPFVLQWSLDVWNAFYWCSNVVLKACILHRNYLLVMGRRVCWSVLSGWLHDAWVTTSDVLVGWLVDCMVGWLVGWWMDSWMDGSIDGLIGWVSDGWSIGYLIVGFHQIFHCLTTFSIHPRKSAYGDAIISEMMA